MKALKIYRPLKMRFKAVLRGFCFYYSTLLLSTENAKFEPFYPVRICLSRCVVLLFAHGAVFKLVFKSLEGVLTEKRILLPDVSAVNIRLFLADER